MYRLQLAPLRQSPLCNLDSRTLADIGIDRLGNASDTNDPRFGGRRRMPGVFSRLIDSIVVHAAQRVGITGLSPVSDPSTLEQERQSFSGSDGRMQFRLLSPLFGLAIFGGRFGHD